MAQETKNTTSNKDNPEPKDDTKKQVAERVDSLARVLQIVALIIVGILTFAETTGQTTRALPIWLIPSILGIAAGLNPEQVTRIAVEIAQVFSRRINK